MSDSPHLPQLSAGIETDAVIADEGYDSVSNRQAIRIQGAEPCNPTAKQPKEAGSL